MYGPCTANSNGVKKAKNAKNRFLAKMAAKTTSGSGFHFRFVFYAVNVVENEYNIAGVRRTLFEIFGAKVRKFKKYLNELQEFPTCNFLIFCGH